MSFGEGNLHERVAQLESLVRDMWDGMCGNDRKRYKCRHFRTDGASFGECVFKMRMAELRIDTEGGA